MGVDFGIARLQDIPWRIASERPQPPHPIPVTLGTDRGSPVCEGMPELVGHDGRRVGHDGRSGYPLRYKADIIRLGPDGSGLTESVVTPGDTGIYRYFSHVPNL